MKTYYDKDADLKVLKGKKVAVIGYGSQGHAHSLNMKDSGIDVRVGLRKTSKHWAEAKKAGLKVVEIEQAAKEAIDSSAATEEASAALDQITRVITDATASIDRISQSMGRFTT